MSDRTFTLPELAALIEIEYRTLHTWIGRGLLSASCEQAHGSGTRNLFDRADAVEAYVLADLRRAGVELGKLEQVAAYLRDLRSHDAEEDRVLVINGSVSLASRDQLGRAASKVSPTLVYDLQHARSAVGVRLGQASE